MATISEVLEKIIEQYKPGAGFGAGEKALLERAKVKAMAGVGQQLASAGLAGTTVGAGVSQRWEEEIGMPARLRLEDVRTQRLTEALLAKAGFMQEERKMEFGAAEAEKARQFAAAEAEKVRKFGASEAEVSRQFQMSYAQKAREFGASEAQITREFQAAEAGKGRTFAAAEAGKQRQFAAGQAALARPSMAERGLTAFGQPLTQGPGGPRQPTAPAPTIHRVADFTIPTMPTYTPTPTPTGPREIFGPMTGEYGPYGSQAEAAGAARPSLTTAAPVSSRRVGGIETATPSQAELIGQRLRTMYPGRGY